MRDKNRIKQFCNELSGIWETKCPDWRFGQLISNVLGQMQGEGRDIFFPEEKEMIDYFKKYFRVEDSQTLSATEIFGYTYEPDGVGSYKTCHCKECKNTRCLWCRKDKYAYCSDFE